MSIRRKQRDPLVYMTLGTNTNTADISMFRSVLGGLEDQDVDVLLTVGDSADPNAVGCVPSTRTPNDMCLNPCCCPSAVVICHGGAGTTLRAVAHGCPRLVLPQGADQYIIGDQVVAFGAGLRLAPPEVNADSVRRCVVELLKIARSTAARHVGRKSAIAAMRHLPRRCG